mgnify:CR=1 FL=1
MILTIGIAIAICLLSGTIIASNSLASSMIMENLENVKVDYTITVNSNNTTEIINKITTETAEFEEVSGVYPAIGINNWATILKPGNGTDDWSFINHTSRRYDFFNDTKFLGLDPEYVNHPNIADAFSFLDSNYTDSETGIYISSYLAEEHNLTKGDYLTIRTFMELEFTNLTLQIGTFKILGVFEILSNGILSQIFEGSWGGSYFTKKDFLVLSTFNFTKNLSVLLNPDTDYLGMFTTYGVLVEHEKMPIFDTEKLEQRLIQINNRLRQAVRSYSMKTVNSNILNVISTSKAIISLINNILVMISIPVLLLTWFLIKTNYQLSFTERNREIGLLKAKGATESQIRSILNVESLSIGFIGSLIGLLCGAIASGLISRYLYHYEGNINYLNLIVSAFTKFDIIIPWVVAGILFSYISSKKPIKEFVQRNPAELLGYYEPSHAEIERKKYDVLILILGIFPLVFSFIMSLLQQSMYLYFISILLSALNVVLLILGPFLLVYAIVKLLCGRSIGFFTKIIHAITSKFDKNRAFFIQKSILNNQARAAKIIFVIGMFISFLTMNTTIIASEQEYQQRLEFVTTGGGIQFSLFGGELSRNGKYTEYSIFLTQQSNLSIDYVAPFIYENSLRINHNNDDYFSEMSVPKSFQICKIEPLTIYQAVKIPNEWFVDITYEEAMTKLVSVPNSTIIPFDYAKTENLKIGDYLSFEYEGNSSEPLSIQIQIVGFYHYFPIVSSNNFQAYGLINVNTANDTAIRDRHFNLVVYPNASVKETLKPSHVRDALEAFDPHLYIYSSGLYDEEITSPGMIMFDTEILFKVVIDFIMIEKIFLVLIVSFGLAIVMFASINEKSRQFALLRARGVPTKVMYQIQLSEGAVFLIISILIGFSGILSAYSFISQINNLMMFFSALQRVLVIPWLQIFVEFGIALFIFILIILGSAKIGLKKSDVNCISEVFRVA